jgi:hypothetical protein
MLSVADLTKSFVSPEGGRAEIVRVGRFELAAGEQRLGLAARRIAPLLAGGQRA